MRGDARYSVLAADEGQSALNILPANPQIDLLVTDIKIAGLNGYPLADT
jgi:CheY-like chemotaxis protein